MPPTLYANVGKFASMPLCITTMRCQLNSGTTPKRREWAHSGPWNRGGSRLTGGLRSARFLLYCTMQLKEWSCGRRLMVLISLISGPKKFNRVKGALILINDCEIKRAGAEPERQVPKVPWLGLPAFATPGQLQNAIGEAVMNSRLDFQPTLISGGGKPNRINGAT